MHYNSQYIEYVERYRRTVAATIAIEVRRRRIAAAAAVVYLLKKKKVYKKKKIRIKIKIRIFIFLQPILCFWRCFALVGLCRTVSVPSLYTAILSKINGEGIKR